MRRLTLTAVLALSTACQEFPMGKCGRYRVHFPLEVTRQDIRDQRMHETCSTNGTFVLTFDDWTVDVEEDGEIVTYEGVHVLMFSPTHPKYWAAMSYNYLEVTFPQAWLEPGAEFEIPTGVAYHCNFATCVGHQPLTSGHLKIGREGKTDDLWGYTNYRMKWEFEFGEPGDPESERVWATGRGSDWVDVSHGVADF